MTDTKTWNVPSQYVGGDTERISTTEVVTYADHVAAVTQARDEGYEYGFNSNDTAFMEGYEQGQRDARDDTAWIEGLLHRRAEEVLAAAVQRVEALFPMPDLPQPIRGEQVIAAIKGEQA